jgi:prepilin-type processing-associated H-X9-DG protein
MPPAGPPGSAKGASSQAPVGVSTYFCQSGPPTPPAGVLPSGYYYHEGLRYNVGQLLPLAGDSQPRHNERANMLFTDGSIRSVTAQYWLQLWQPLMPPAEAPPAKKRPRGAPYGPGGDYDE